MQIRETVKYDVKKLHQAMPDTIRLCHADNVAYPKLGGLRRMRAFQSERNQMKFERGQREVVECQRLI